MRGPINKRKIGAWYEQMAAEYLKGQGMVILEQNYRVRQGEIDLIGKDGDCLVFVEVKYRRNGINGDPAEAVTPDKQRHIRQAANRYLYRCQCGDVLCRFDVVSILGREVQWIQDAF